MQRGKQEDNRGTQSQWKWKGVMKRWPSDSTSSAGLYTPAVTANINNDPKL